MNGNDYKKNERIKRKNEKPTDQKEMKKRDQTQIRRE